MRELMNYPWPGNVRELENCIERAVVLSKGNRIEVSNLPPWIIDLKLSKPEGSRPNIIQQSEKQLLIEALEVCNWNKKQAARHLGISRCSLYNKLKKFRINASPAIH